MWYLCRCGDCGFHHTKKVMSTSREKKKAKICHGCARSLYMQMQGWCLNWGSKAWAAMLCFVHSSGCLFLWGRHSLQGCKSMSSFVRHSTSRFQVSQPENNSVLFICSTKHIDSLHHVVCPLRLWHGACNSLYVYYKKRTKTCWPGTNLAQNCLCKIALCEKTCGCLLLSIPYMQTMLLAALSGFLVHWQSRSTRTFDSTCTPQIPKTSIELEGRCTVRVSFNHDSSEGLEANEVDDTNPINANGRQNTSAYAVNWKSLSLSYFHFLEETWPQFKGNFKTKYIYVCLI